MEALGGLALDARHALGLIAAVVFGALIGLERQLRNEPPSQPDAAWRTYFAEPAI